MSELNFTWDEMSWGEDEYGNPFDDESLYRVSAEAIVAEAADASFFLRAMADLVEIDDADRLEWMGPLVAPRMQGAGVFVSATYLELAAMQRDDPSLGPEGHQCLLVPEPAAIDIRRWPSMPKSSAHKQHRVAASRRMLCADLLRGWADYLDAAVVTLTTSAHHEDAADWIHGLFGEAEEQATSTVSLWLRSRGQVS